MSYALMALVYALLLGLRLVGCWLYIAVVSRCGCLRCQMDSHHILNLSHFKLKLWLVKL